MIQRFAGTAIALALMAGYRHGPGHERTSGTGRHRCLQ